MKYKNMLKQKLLPADFLTGSRKLAIMDRKRILLPVDKKLLVKKTLALSYASKFNIIKITTVMLQVELQPKKYNIGLIQSELCQAPRI